MDARLIAFIALASGASCAPATGARGTGAAAPAAATAARDTSLTDIPPGLGSLRQDDIALRMQLLGLQVRAIPLDESIIRVLSPDSYRSLHDLLASQQAEVHNIARRTGGGASTTSVWYVSFFTSEPGETRYSPMEVIVTSAGRDFRPLDVIPLTPGFGSQRLKQRESQSALYVFEGLVDVNQALSLSYESAQATDWSRILERVERERVLVRTRGK